MTAPHTPPHQPSASDPWAVPPSAGSAAPFPEDDGPGIQTELKEAAVIAVAVTVCGAFLGLLWNWLAPRVPLVADERSVFLKEIEGEQAIGADGTFLLLALAFGVLSGLVVFLARKRGGVPLVVGLALGGLLASVVAWRLGILVGPGGDVVARAKEAGPGVTFDAPLELNAIGALLAWPIAALAVHLGLTALFGPRDPEFDAVPYHDWSAAPGGKHGPEGGARES
ncbi:hypothetical protein [Streptomyces boluensis]|uniref:hypothetical protein n=1 Tax=Streptomyces boluensis TaxID=1775135 RepID=UPI001651D3DA|nr:hypothetical protein [Streptomyces boluensis]